MNCWRNFLCQEKEGKNITFLSLFYLQSAGLTACMNKSFVANHHQQVFWRAEPHPQLLLQFYSIRKLILQD